MYYLVVVQLGLDCTQTHIEQLMKETAGIGKNVIFEDESTRTGSLIC